MQDSRAPSRSRALRLSFDKGEVTPQETVPARAQSLFIQAVENVAPEAMDALRDGGPLDCCRRLVLEWERALLDASAWGDYIRRYGPRGFLAVARDPSVCDPALYLALLGWEDVRRASAEDGIYPDLVPLRDALLAWSERFNLREAWLLDVALDNLRLWSKHPRTARFLSVAAWSFDSRRWQFPTEDERRVVVAAGDGITVTVEWNPLKESWEDLKRKLRKLRGLLGSREREVEDHFRRVLESLEQRGYIKPPVKRNRSGSPLLHFEWLAMYQVKGMDYEEIAQAYTDADPSGERAITTDAVRKAVEETAKLVGLQLRK